ncbi:hypothetical protein LWI28_002697 [Acer negundo]|uniref:CCHC-type domain-containing protein n=1 Tax=Acer negundo TaxID=4023 RepID=A0AAD5NL28_ACENE|nr:hypothetical protein LWI28_002697 [Acer negundo]
MSAQLRIDTNMDASKWQFYRAKRIARQMVDGGIKEQYSKLREYAAEVMKMNHDTTIILKCDDSGRFVEKIKQESVYCYPQYSGNYTYQVRARGEEQFVVEINRRTYGCNMWQLIGIPCVHGMTVVLSTNHDPMDFIHLRYKKETFIQAYTLIIYGINRPKMWPKSNEAPMKCPDFRKQRGRPKKKRNLQSDKVRNKEYNQVRRNYIVVTCKKCGKKGHNRATCDKRGGGTDSVATIEGKSQSIGGSQSVVGSQDEHQDGQPKGGKRTRTQKYMGCCFISTRLYCFCV